MSTGRSTVAGLAAAIAVLIGVALVPILRNAAGPATRVTTQQHGKEPISPQNTAPSPATGQGARADPPRSATPTTRAGATSAPTTPSPTQPVSPPPSGLLELTHQVSAYGIPAKDIARAAALGVSLGFSDYAAPGSQYSAALKTAHLRYVDMSLWDLVYHATAGCSSKTTTPCVLPPGTEDKLLADVTAHLDRIASDESVVGLYVLDDYPGNISDLLVKVHELVQRANQHSRWAHQTICGFAAQLDYQGRNLAWNRPRGLIHKVLTNYSPDACDVVQIYSYTPRSMSPGASADWSMGALLPDVVSLLEQRGWKPGSPLIGTPMAFTLPAENWQGPDTDQFRTQIEAFCSGGATAIVPFAWDFSHSGPKFELGNDPRLQLGLEEGITACKATWTS